MSSVTTAGGDATLEISVTTPDGRTVNLSGGGAGGSGDDGVIDISYDSVDD